MFRWYQRAQECYAYLNDVLCDGEDAVNFEDFRPPESPVSGDAEHALRNSEWFSRGWTLQELLALAHVLFIERD